MPILHAATANSPALNAQRDAGQIARIIAAKPARHPVNVRLYVNCN
jgi:hypothetical protein